MSVIKKGTKLYSILNFKCPKCHEGNFFKNKGILNLNNVTQTHENCPSCNLKYMMEPSFFYGAMYVGYGLTVGLSILVFLIGHYLFNLDLLQNFLSIIIVLVLTATINLKISRIIWINIFVAYQGKINSYKN